MFLKVLFIALLLLGLFFTLFGVSLLATLDNVQHVAPRRPPQRLELGQSGLLLRATT